MTGIYIKCDSCGKTLGGEQVSPKERGLHWSEAHILKEEALNLGWTGELDRSSTSDRCPECSSAPANTQKE
jgi:hypothetical protein